MSWEAVVGQRRAIEILEGVIRSGRVAHAYLFSGPEGSGQDALAIEFARALLCEKGGTEACGACRSCARSRTLQHPNLKVIMALPVGRNEKYGDSPLAKLSESDVAAVREQLRLKAENPYHRITVPRGNTIKINSIREMRREASLTGFEEGRKVFLLFDAERLGDESSNALLKTLEEPPGDTTLLLTTDSPDLLLPTIVSRCQPLRLSPISAEEIGAALESRGVEAPDALLAARVSNGSYSRALQSIRTGLREKRREAVDFLRAALRTSREEVVRSIDAVGQRYQRQEMEEFLSLLREWLRDAMMVREGQAGGGSEEDREALRKFVVRYGAMDLASAEQALDRAVSLIGRNVYIPLVLLNLALALRESIAPSEESYPRTLP